MIKSLVSIIIPTFNRAELVNDAIRSAQAQTYPHKQIIVVDDGSVDSTARLISSIEGVEYYHQENRGQGAARNLGLSKAKGEYIASLDSDDIWDDDYLERSIDCLQEFCLDFVFTNWTKVREGQSHPSEWLRDRNWRPYRADLRGDWCLLEHKQLRRLFLEICPAPSSSLVVRRRTITSGWGEHMKIADDWYLLLSMVLNHPCTAAFTLTPRWRKRVDGQNIYDGQPLIESIEKLYLHDYRLFRRDFASQLTHREKFFLVSRTLKYRTRVLFHQANQTELGIWLKMPKVVAHLRSLMRRSVNEQTVVSDK
jgi:glycosyltransferase involved in cell wall biosynthesis